MHWQYRTILFEFQKDGLLGDKYIDDEEVETQLNEQGAMGWELVNVTMIQEGLLAFCKRQTTGAGGGMHPQEVQQFALEPADRPEPEPVSAETVQQQECQHIRNVGTRRRETMAALENDVIGEIKIS